MGNSLRCFLACVLPCGALDLIRVVHIDGHVDEYTGHVSAGEILMANPNHVLNKACYQGGGVHRIIVVSPESDLKRGNIYFLVPVEKSSEEKKKKKTADKEKKKMQDAKVKEEDMVVVDNQSVGSSEKKPCHRRRRSSSVRVGVWKPNLQSISED